MNCRDFEHWLDEGGPGAGAAEAASHAASCVSCARAQRAADSLESLLAAPPAPAPAGFTDRVMARVRPAAPLSVAPFSPPMPWWIRAAGDPVTVLALGLAAAVAWGWDGLWAVAAAARSALAGVGPPAALPDLAPSTALGLQLAMATLLALLAPGLHRMAARLAARGPIPRP